MADTTDFMTFLNDHQGAEVMIEVGVPADDLDRHSRRLAKYHGRLGAMRDIDDDDRPGRAIGWVPIGDEGDDLPLMGFFLEADRVVEVIVNLRGAIVRFVDHQYLSVTLRSL